MNFFICRDFFQNMIAFFSRFRHDEAECQWRTAPKTLWTFRGVRTLGELLFCVFFVKTNGLSTTCLYFRLILFRTLRFLPVSLAAGQQRRHSEASHCPTARTEWTAATADIPVLPRPDGGSRCSVTFWVRVRVAETSCTWRRCQED